MNEEICNNCRKRNHDGLCEALDLQAYRLKVLKEFEGAAVEIGANKTLAAGDSYNQGWNAGAEMAIRFIKKYAVGQGLFQDPEVPA